MYLLQMNKVPIIQVIRTLLAKFEWSASVWKEINH